MDSIKLDDTSVELEENTPVVDPNKAPSEAVIKNEELIGKFVTDPKAMQMHHVIVPWFKVALLGGLVHLVLGLSWGFVSNSIYDSLEKASDLVMGMDVVRAALYLLALPLAYKILKRWAVDVPFVIASFSLLFLYGIYRIGQLVPGEFNPSIIASGSKLSGLSSTVENPVVILPAFLLIGVFIFMFATLATNARKFRVSLLIMLLLIAVSPYFGYLFL